MLAYARRTPHPLLWADMRLGKTPVTIRTVEHYGPAPRALVVAPNSALGGWERALAAECVPECDVVRLRGARDERLALLTGVLHGDARWALINKEGWQVVPEIAGHLRCCACRGRGWVPSGDEEQPRQRCVSCAGEGSAPGDPFPWDAVILDESTFVKSARARVTRFFLGNFRSVPHRWSLTGLPCPESALDYWCQVAWARRDATAFGCGSYWQFRARHFEEDLYDDGKFSLKPGSAEYVARVVESTAFVLGRDAAGVGSEKVRCRREVELPADLRRAYRQAEREFALDYGDAHLETLSSGARWQWLRQMCGGFVDHKLVWDGKLRELRDLLAGEFARQQVVVWFAYNQEVAASADLLRRAGIRAGVIMGEVSPGERHARVAAWRAGDARVLLSQEAVANQGVDMSAADTEMYYSSHPSGEMRQQSEDRLVHPQKRTPILVVDLLVPDSVDEDVADLLLDKRVRSQRDLARAALWRARRRHER